MRAVPYVCRHIRSTTQTATAVTPIGINTRQCRNKEASPTTTRPTPIATTRMIHVTFFNAVQATPQPGD